MNITSKSRMRMYDKIKYILPLSDTNITSEISAFAVPKKIGLIKVSDIYSVTINDIFKLWDCTDENKLLQLTLDIFLLDKWYKKVLYKLQYFKAERLPLIDFTRLIIQSGDLSKLAAEKFASCKVNYDDERYESILKKYSGNQVDLIRRFCNLMPAYTIEQALKMTWYDIYLVFKSDANSQNIQLEISKLEPKK